ncbi:MAG TPA: TonB-dependent receptor [Vicinamibacterales bacterium]|nr:TonB-dependent receptor [Vicinamibacterales bacterium]
MKTRSVAILLVLTAFAAPAAAQIRITGSIAGTVTDTADGVVPGATVLLKDEATGRTRDAVTNESGIFSFPDLNHGTYSITVSLQGFRTAVYNKVAVESGRTTDLRVRLGVGGIEEMVTVEGASPVLETSSNMISATLNRKTITEIPLAGRNVFTMATLVPGAASPQGGSPHYNGMPGGTINPTIDGVNNSSNGWKSGGTSFFGTVPARLGAIEEVTIETTGQGAEAGAMGGVNLKFVTRRGTNQYRGSGFWQHRNEAFNANSFSNNARNIEKNRLRRHDFGGSFGGPLAPGTALRDKLFLFINYEQEYIPQTQTREETVLKPQTEQGVFTYQTASGEVRTANVLDIARAAGHPSTIDPLIARMLAGHREARQYSTVSSTNSLLSEEIAWREPQQTDNYYPTARLDYQISNNLALMGSWNFYRQDTSGRRVFPLPDFPPQLDTQTRAWWIGSTGLNWSITSNTHNEFRYGVQHSGDTIPFREAKYYEQLNGVLNGKPVRFPNNLPLGLQPLANDAAPITGRHYITTLSDTLTMMKGSHKWTLGTTFRFTDWRDTSLDGPGSGGFLGLPRYTLGMPAGDPAQGIFSSSSMPGIQNADLANVRNLYALLTGRVSDVTTGRILDPATLQYSDSIYRENWTASKMGGIFAQDQWRMTPDFTLNYGVRYEVTGHPYSKLENANFPDVANLFGPSTALFQPGQLNGVLNPTIVRGKSAAKTDWNNVAPNIGFAWTPMASEGSFLSKLIGGGRESVIRGSYSLTYYDEGTNMFAFNAGSNPGYGQSLRLQPGIGFQPGELTLQTPLPPFVAFPLEYKEVFPQSDFTFSNGFRTMKDDLQTPYVHSWNIGVQRQIAPHTVIEARYLGTRGENVWRTYNINEVNVFENGFLDDFRNAQRNLEINAAAGVNSFQNRGLPGQVPLPIFETAFGPRGSQPALASGSGFTNGGFITNLQQGVVGALANSIAGNANYVCRLYGNTFAPCVRLGYNAPGPYPINMFYANPFAGSQGAWLVDDQSYTRYHALQMQLRQRYWHGVQMSVNYTLAKSSGDIWAENSTQEANYRTLRDRSLDNTAAHYDVRHVLQSFGTYDLPFGRDRQFRINNGILDAIVGGWTIGGTLTAQSGSPFRLNGGRATFNQHEAGIILVNGTTLEDLQNAIQFSQGPGLNRYWIDPKYIGPDGRANPEYIRVPSAPGELGQLVILRGKATWNLDAALNKDFDLPGRTNLRLHVTMTNVLNHPVWGTPDWNDFPSITSTTFGQTGSPINGARQMYIRTEISF